MQIEPEMSVRQVEQAFWNTFGLEVQIFRKSGNKWLMTNSSDLWTLKEQNSKAEEMDLEIEKSEGPDYKEQD
jgi:hypothetical protein